MDVSEGTMLFDRLMAVQVPIALLDEVIALTAAQLPTPTRDVLRGRMADGNHAIVLRKEACDVLLLVQAAELAECEGAFEHVLGRMSPTPLDETNRRFKTSMLRAIAADTLSAADGPRRAIAHRRIQASLDVLGDSTPLELQSRAVAEGVC